MDDGHVRINGLSYPIVRPEDLSAEELERACRARCRIGVLIGKGECAPGDSSALREETLGLCVRLLARLVPDLPEEKILEMDPPEVEKLVELSDTLIRAYVAERKN